MKLRDNGRYVDDGVNDVMQRIVSCNLQILYLSSKNLLPYWFSALDELQLRKITVNKDNYNDDKNCGDINNNVTNM